MASKSLTWIFSLVDKVSTPAKGIDKALGAVKQAVDAVSKASEAMDKTISRASGGYLGIVKGFRGSADAAKKASTNGYSGFVKGLKTAADAARDAYYPIELLGKGLDVAQYVGGLAVAGGQFAVDALAFKESSLASLKIIAGTKEKAKSLFDQAVKMGAETPFETEDVVRGYQQLLSAGFKDTEVPIVFRAVGDVAAASGFNKEVIGSLATVFAQIKAAGKLQGQDLMQVLNSTATAGVGRLTIFESIAKRMKIATKDVEKMMSDGKVDSGNAILGILDAIKEKSGGKFGQQMLDQSSTLTGLFSTLSSAPKDFFLKMDLSEVPGLESFKSFVENLIELLDTTSATGQRIQATLMRVFGGALKELFGGFSGDGGMKVLEGIFTKVLDVVDMLISAFRVVWAVLKPVGAFVVGLFDGMLVVLGPVIELLGSLFGGASGMSSVMRYLGKAIGVVVGVIAALVAVLAVVFSPIALVVAGIVAWVSAITDLFDVDWGYFGEQITGFFSGVWESIKGFFVGLWENFKALGGHIVDGLIAGFTGNIDGVIAAVKGVATSAVDILKSVLGIASPSKVFTQLGSFTAAGFEQGITRGTPGVTDAMSEMASPVLPTARTVSLSEAAQAAGGGRASLSMVQHIYAGGASPDASQALANQVGSETRRALVSFFGDLALESGATS